MINTRESREYIIREAELRSMLEELAERILAPLASEVMEIEELKRKELLTPDEVERIYGLKAATLANKRSRAQGPEYVKDGEKILYPQKAVKAYLAARHIRTID